MTMIKSGCIMRRYDRPVEIAGRVEPYGCDDVDDRQHPGLADDRDDFPSWGRDDPAYQVPMDRPKYDDRVKTGYTHGRDDFPPRVEMIQLLWVSQNMMVMCGVDMVQMISPPRVEMIEPVRFLWSGRNMMTECIWAILIEEMISPPRVEIIQLVRFA